MYKQKRITYCFENDNNNIVLYKKKTNDYHSVFARPRGSSVKTSINIDSPKPPKQISWNGQQTSFARKATIKIVSGMPPGKKTRRSNRNSVGWEPSCGELFHPCHSKRPASDRHWFAADGIDQLPFWFVVSYRAHIYIYMYMYIFSFEIESSGFGQFGSQRSFWEAPSQQVPLSAAQNRSDSNLSDWI